MGKLLTYIAFMLIGFICQAQQTRPATIITTDIDNFWTAYSKIASTKDSTLQYKYLDSLYLLKATPGLRAIIQARAYTPKDYITAINSYPLFWASVKRNTLKAPAFATALEQGFVKLKKIYPYLKPARIYFTIGALRTNGTTVDSLVLIGSELAMTDRYTIATEFTEEDRAARETFFKSNPIDNLIFLNIHEYIHTQQKPMVHNLLSEVIAEGIAEFVTTKVLGIPSTAPAIEFGKKNQEKVREKFEKEMFYLNNRPKWLWSNAANDFGVRDLGYYIGYQMSELYYSKEKGKKQAIKKLIQIDYTNNAELERFVDGIGFFSAPLEELYQNFEKKRPTVGQILPFGNNSETVSPDTKQITVEFSEPLNGYNTGIDYGPLGTGSFPAISNTNRIWSKDGRTWTISVSLEPNKHYQFLISNNFRTQDGIPLKPVLVDFKTTSR